MRSSDPTLLAVCLPESVAFKDLFLQESKNAQNNSVNLRFISPSLYHDLFLSLFFAWLVPNVLADNADRLWNAPCIQPAGLCEAETCMRPFSARNQLWIYHLSGQTNLNKFAWKKIGKKLEK